MTEPTGPPSRSGLAIVAVVVGVNVIVLLLLVLMGLRHEQPPAYTPTAIQPHPARGLLVGPRVVTVDATSADQWRFFSFDEGSVVPRSTGTNWDLAFRRFEVIVNGGDGYAGAAGIRDLGELPFADVHRVPTSGYLTTNAGGDSINEAVRKWYDYSYLSHVLTPKPRTYAVRTAEGRYAKLQFLGYYCPQATPGCLTFRYVYQGDGGTSFARARSVTNSP